MTTTNVVQSKACMHIPKYSIQADTMTSHCNYDNDNIYMYMYSHNMEKYKSC